MFEISYLLFSASVVVAFIAGLGAGLIIGKWPR